MTSGAETVELTNNSRVNADQALARCAKPPRVARALMWPLLAVILIHTIMIGLWVAPNTAIRQEIGSDRISEYVLPWFEQNWSIFAPTPRRADVMLEVRAHVVPEGDEDAFVTEWADLTDIENSLIPGNVTPPRTILITRRIADRMNRARADMNNEQVDILKLHFYETPIEELEQRLLAVEGGNRSAVERYMVTDDMATLIANAHAEVTWGDSGQITRVQYRTSSRRVPPYSQRDDAGAEEVVPVVREYGWRHGIDIPEEHLKHFQFYAAQEVE